MKKLMKWLAVLMVAIMTMTTVLPMTAEASSGYSTKDMFKYSRIKGMQGAVENSLYEDGNHITVEIYLDELIKALDTPWAAPPIPWAPRYDYEGEAFYLLWPEESTLNKIRQANNEGKTVNAVFLMKKSVDPYGSDSSFVIDQASCVEGYSYYAPNTDLSTYGGRAVLAYWHYLMEEVLLPEGLRIDNFILGNQVNMPKEWHCAGNAYTQATKYADAFYGMCSAVKKYTNANFTVSLKKDAAEGNGISTTDFMSAFESRMAQYGSNVEWDVSYSDNTGKLYHTLSNVCLDDIIYESYRSGTTAYEFEGEYFYFKDALSGIRPYSNKGMSISVVFLLRKKSSSEFIIDEASRVDGYAYYAPNADLSTYGGRAVRAFWHYFMEQLVREGLQVDNFILGNEVNMPNQWHYSGSPNGSGDAYNCVTKYADAFYQMYSAVRKYTDVSRCSISLDHSWQNDNEGKGIAAKDFLNLFNSSLQRYKSDVEWCLSTHLYPARLYDTRIWVDPHNLAPRHSGARIIDGNNLFVMTNYIRDTFGEEHRVMLTEQGFSDNYGEAVQAACLAYTYYAAKYDPMVDNFLINTENAGGVHDEDGYQSMNFTLMPTALEIYNRIDNGNPEDQAWIDSVCLPVIGVGSWADIVPNYGQEKDLPSAEEVEAVTAFCERMYTIALGRAADEAGVTFWTDALLAHTTDGASIAKGFIISEEFVLKSYTNEQFLRVLYRTFMDREADEGGLAYWGQELVNGSSREAVLAGFVNSPEFEGICASYGIERGTFVPEVTAISTGIYDFVDRCYTYALGRNGDEGGIHFWAQNLVYNYATPEQIANSFYLSAEYLAKNTTDEDFVKSCYLTFMGREADEGGLEYWKGDLANGVTRETILKGFIYSTEFKNILASYGL